MLRRPQQTQRIIEIGGEKEPLNLPIVKFPPFKLRAQLIEKDPVVWLHLIETYVKYCQWLMAGDNSMGHGSHITMIDQLDDNTLDHLRIFLRSYLHEMALEEGKLVSLGYNQDVKDQLQLLRSWIFHIIKSCGLIYLQISGGALWDLIKLYVTDNPQTIQALVLGNLVPTVNVQKAQINRVTQLQQTLKSIIESNKFDRTDLKTLQVLLSYHDKENNGGLLKFADEFLSMNWVENLELWWSKGKGRFHELAKQICITLLLSTQSKKLVYFIQIELDIKDVDSLLYYPLLGSVLTNDHFLGVRHDIFNRLPFLSVSATDNLPKTQTHNRKGNNGNDSSNDANSIIQIEVNENDINSLQELFPDLSKDHATQLLRRYDNNVELITNELFENPSIIKSLEPEVGLAREEETPSVTYNDEREQKEDDDEEEEDENTPLVLLKKKDDTLDKSLTKHVPDEIRNKTLTRALKLLYQDDDDERDDTYDEAQAENNRINSGSQRIGMNKEGSNNDAQDNSDKKDNISQTDRNEAYLWDLLKQDKTLFARSQRGSRTRKKIRNQTNWSDEQIEGWARMLERSPQRAKLLEEKYMFKGNVRTGKTSYVKNKDGGESGETSGRTFSGPRPARNPKLGKKKYQRGPKKGESNANESNSTDGNNNQNQKTSQNSSKPKTKPTKKKK